MYFVVPIAVKLIPFDFDFSEFSITYFASLLIFFAIQPSMYLQPFLGRGRTNELDNDLHCFQRNTSPVASDMAK